jgi:hypothetical protein
LNSPMTKEVMGTTQFSDKELSNGKEISSNQR